VAGGLKARLARLRDGRDDRHAREPAGSRPRPAFLGGWQEQAPFLFAREVLRPFGAVPFIDAAPFLPRSSRPPRADSPFHMPIETGRLRFFDLETTGLSGGAGTISFLACVGEPREEGLLLRQFFLSDYPGEKAFVAAVLGCLGPDGVVVSYNGRAFDLPLLRTRCIMNGLIPPDPLHLDLLHTARRLWRSAHGGASLGLLEEGVLGLRRGPDVPGSRIPGVWFEFLAAGDHLEMPLVLSHNAFDVEGLASLFFAAASAYEDPLGLAAAAGLDRGGLGRSLIALGRFAEGEGLLEAAAKAGDERSGILLSRRFGRSGRLEDRRRIAALLGVTYEGMVERAKFHEHGERDYDAALRCVKEARRLSTGETERAALRVRRERLLRKKTAAEVRGGQAGRAGRKGSGINNN
jgi:hypothetical protein